MTVRLIVLAALAAMVLGGSLSYADVREGDRAPDWTNVRSTRNKKLSHRHKYFRDKFVVVTFGASWCKPCKKELPALEALALKLRKERLPVEFVAINIDENERAGRKFMRGRNLECVIAGYDPQGTTKDVYAPPKMPSTYIIDPKRIVRHLHASYYKGDERKLEKVLRSLIRK